MLWIIDNRPIEDRWLREEYGLTRPFLHVARLRLPHPFYRPRESAGTDQAREEKDHDDNGVPPYIDVRCDELPDDLEAFVSRIPLQSVASTEAD
jgi:hypothetical protein